MSETLTGGKLAAATNKARHGEDFYVRMGKKGGQAGHTGGFHQKVLCGCSIITGLHTKPQCAGAKGGRKSRRGPTKKAD